MGRSVRGLQCEISKTKCVWSGHVRFQLVGTPIEEARRGEASPSVVQVREVHLVGSADRSGRGSPDWDASLRFHRVIGSGKLCSMLSIEGVRFARARCRSVGKGCGVATTHFRRARPTPFVANEPLHGPKSLRIIGEIKLDRYGRLHLNEAASSTPSSKQGSRNSIS